MRPVEAENALHFCREFNGPLSVSELAALTGGRVCGKIGYKCECYFNYGFRMFREAFADLCALKVAAGERGFIEKAEAWYFRDICVAFDQLTGG